MKERFLQIAVANVLAAVALALPAGGSARTTAAPCVARPCQYTVQAVIEYTIGDRGRVSITARFPRVALHKARSLRQLTGGSNYQRLIGTVSGEVSFRGQDCVHERTYTAPAKLDVRGTITARRAFLTIEFASPSEVPPNWAATCPRLRDLNPSLGEAITGGTLVGRTAARQWYAAVGSGAQTLLGADSLAGQYNLIIRGPQRLGSLSPPFRQLWAGKSAIVREHTERPGLGRFDVRISFTRR